MDRYNGFVAHTKSDTDSAATNIADMNYMGLYVGGAGNAVLVMPDGSLVTVTGLLAGTVYPFCGFKRINSTNTTAGNFLLLYRR